MSIFLKRVFCLCIAVMLALLVLPTSGLGSLGSIVKSAGIVETGNVGDSMIPSQAFSGAATVNGKEMKYLVQSPRTSYYKAGDTSIKYPVIIYLHDSGEQGNVDKYMKGEKKGLLQENISKDLQFPFFVIAPRMPTDSSHPNGTAWSSMYEQIIKALDSIATQYPVDTGRIYLAGFGTGAEGIWGLAQSYPKRFSAIVAASGKGNVDKAEIIKDIPARVYHGNKDKVIPVSAASEMVIALRTFNDEVNFTIFNGGHELLPETFDDGTFKWLLKQGKAQTVLPEGDPELLIQSEGKGYTVESNDIKMEYYVQTPRVRKGETGVSSENKRYPVLLYLHGSGGETDVDDLISGKRQGFMQEYISKDYEFPFIVIAPKLPSIPSTPGVGAWASASDLVMKALDTVITEYNADPDRVYLMGHSLGGMGTYDVATKYPDRFAAIAPMSGAGKRDELYKIRHLPIWVFHGDRDYNPRVHYNIAKDMVRRLQDLGANVKFTALPAEHMILDKAWNEGTFQWLLKQNRANNQKSSPPPKNIKLPAAPVMEPIDDSSTDVFGKTTPYYTVIVKNGATVLGTDIAGEDGEFAIELESPQKAGAVLTVTATGIYGTVGTPAKLVVKDATAPNAPLVNAVGASSKAVSGNAEAGCTVTVKSGKSVLGTTTAKANGYFYIGIKPQKVGTVLQVFVTDKAGNKSEETKVTVKK